jgi:hypothetical protein
VDDSNPEHENASLSQLHRLNDLRGIAVAQAARVTAREPNHESKRRWAIVKEIEDAKKRLQSLPIEGTPAALNVPIDAIKEEIDATQQKDDAAADLAARRSMEEWIRYERDQKAREARSQLHTLLKQICKKEKITINTWLRDHDIDRSQYYLSKHAGGKPVEGKVSVDMAEKIKAAILRDAVELGLEVPEGFT